MAANDRQEDPKVRPAAYLSQADEHERYRWIGGSEARIILDSAATDGKLTLFERILDSTYRIGSHTHHAEDEGFFVVEGNISGRVGREKFAIGPGGVAFMPRGVPHSYQVDSDSARLLIFALPGGVEDVFRVAGWNLSQPEPENWDVDYDALTTFETGRGNKVAPAPRPSSV